MNLLFFFSVGKNRDKVTCHTFGFQIFLLEHKCACANGCENTFTSTSTSSTSSSTSKFAARHVYMKLYLTISWQHAVYAQQSSYFIHAEYF